MTVKTGSRGARSHGDTGAKALGLEQPGTFQEQGGHGWSGAWERGRGGHKAKLDKQRDQGTVLRSLHSGRRGADHLAKTLSRHQSPQRGRAGDLETMPRTKSWA